MKEKPVLVTSPTTWVSLFRLLSFTSSHFWSPQVGALKSHNSHLYNVKMDITNVCRSRKCWEILPIFLWNVLHTPKKKEVLTCWLLKKNCQVNTKLYAMGFGYHKWVNQELDSRVARSEMWWMVLPIDLTENMCAFLASIEVYCSRTFLFLNGLSLGFQLERRPICQVQNIRLYIQPHSCHWISLFLLERGTWILGG